MTSWIEPPPRQRRTGCLGKGCLLIICVFVLLIAAFCIGMYAGLRYFVTSSTPREIPQVQVSETEEKAVRARWVEFETAGKSKQSTRIELTADDINQLIAGSRKMRGKAFVSVENNVARVQVSIPLEKVGFRGRFLNGEFTVRPAADRNPRNLEVTQVSLTGGAASEAVLKALLGTRSVRSYVEEYADEYSVTMFTIEDNKVIIETSSGPVINPN
jgi:hypothetical protein